LLEGEHDNSWLGCQHHRTYEAGVITKGGRKDLNALAIGWIHQVISK
jgi:hypothetical protein